MRADKAVSESKREDGKTGSERFFGSRSRTIKTVWSSLLVFLFTSSLLAACGGGLAPVHNVRAPIAAAHGRSHSLPAVHDAILRSLLGRGWEVDREGPDGIVATIVSKGHSATVLIQFDAQSYAISYLDSSPGLKFNGGAIHRRYNEWIDRLDKTIRKQLANSDAYPVPAAGAPPVGAYPAQPAPSTAPPALAEPAPATAPAPAPPPAGAPAVAPGGPYEAPPPPPPPPPAPAPRR
jgi:hypothetical protein